MTPRRRFRSVALVVSLLATATACGEDAPVAGVDLGTTGSRPDETQPEVEESPTTAPVEADDEVADGASAPSDYPVLHLAAHGPGEPNTVGPHCAVGIDESALGRFRITAPSAWVRRGSSGGTGPSQVRFEVGESDVVVDMSGSADEVILIGDVEFGDEVGTADLGSVATPIVEVTIDDERSGYAIRDVVWLSSLPDLFGGEAAMTVTVTSTEPGLPTLDDAASALSSIRVERCAGIGEAIASMGADFLLAVPVIEDDPLGKAHPGGAQPDFDMAGAVMAWTPEQLAYLLPFEEPIDACVAESLRSSVPDVFPVGSSVVTAVRGPQQDALAAIAERC